MARFQGASIDETSSSLPGHTKQPLHSTVSSGPTVQTKKPVLESLSGSAISVSPKPNFLKNTVSAKSDAEAHDSSRTKALASKFTNTQDDTNANTKSTNKLPVSPKPTLQPATEVKGPGQKPPLNKPFLSSDSKPAIPKPPSSSKPSWVKEDTGGGETGSAPAKAPLVQPKPSSSLSKLCQQSEVMPSTNTDVATKPSLLANSTQKPTSNFKASQSVFHKEADRTEQSDGSVKAEASNPPQAANVPHPVTPAKPSPSKKPSLKKVSPQASSVNGEVTSAPKQNPLPNSLALGSPPAKPNRPPKVNLEPFKRAAEASGDGKLWSDTNGLFNGRHDRHFIGGHVSVGQQLQSCWSWLQDRPWTNLTNTFLTVLISV